MARGRGRDNSGDESDSFSEDPYVREYRERANDLKEVDVSIWADEPEAQYQEISLDMHNQFMSYRNSIYGMIRSDIEDKVDLNETIVGTLQNVWQKMYDIRPNLGALAHQDEGKKNSKSRGRKSDQADIFREDLKTFKSLMAKLNDPELSKKVKNDEERTLLSSFQDWMRRYERVINPGKKFEEKAAARENISRRSPTSLRPSGSSTSSTQSLAKTHRSTTSSETSQSAHPDKSPRRRGKF